MDTVDQGVTIARIVMASQAAMGGGVFASLVGIVCLRIGSGLIFRVVVPALKRL